MKIKLENGAYPLTRAYPTDAGLDIRSMEDAEVPSHGSKYFRTGIHIKLPKNTCGLIVSKSGLNVKHGITSTGLIDEGYDGEIAVKLFNHSDVTYFVHRGDKISQLVIMPVLYEPINVVGDLEQRSERGSNGFGSTGL